jgi:hypothetical protein
LRDVVLRRGGKGEGGEKYVDVSAGCEESENDKKTHTERREREAMTNDRCPL